MPHSPPAIAIDVDIIPKDEDCAEQQFHCGVDVELLTCESYCIVQRREEGEKYPRFGVLEMDNTRRLNLKSTQRISSKFSPNNPETYSRCSDRLRIQFFLRIAQFDNLL